MSKKKVEKPKRKVTKRQLSRWQRQKRRQRIILTAGISIVVAVVGIVSAGLYYQWYVPEVKPLKETVIEVNGTEFRMDYYIEALKFQAGDQPPEVVQFLLDWVLESIKQNELIRQGALALGFSVSDDEIRQEIEVRQEIEEKDYPDNQAVRDIVRTQLLITKLREEYFEPQVPTSTEQRHILAMFLESQSQANEVRDRLEAGEDFTELAGELSLDNLTKEENGDLGWRPRGVLNGLLNTTVVDNYAFSQPVAVLSQPIFDEEKSKGLGYWLVQVLERKAEPEEAHVQAMLLASEEEAQSIRTRLEDGEDFAQLAAELSLLPNASDNKGDLGWITKGTIGQAVEEFIFSIDTEVGSLSQPIRDEGQTTSGGYWLLKVLDSDTQEISDENRGLLVSKAMDDWMSSLLDDPENNIVSYLDDELREFAARKAVEG